MGAHRRVLGWFISTGAGGVNRGMFSLVAKMVGRSSWETAGGERVPELEDMMVKYSQRIGAPSHVPLHFTTENSALLASAGGYKAKRPTYTTVQDVAIFIR